MTLSAWRASRQANPPPSDEMNQSYESLFKSLSVGGSRVDLTFIRQLEVSKYAVSWQLLETLPGDLDWQPVTFTAVMDDGAQFLFHTAMSVAFFEMPEGYSGRRILRVIPAAGAVDGAYRERETCFAVFVEGVDFGPMPIRCRT
jgi:hypothetical protein